MMNNQYSQIKEKTKLQKCNVFTWIVGGILLFSLSLLVRPYSGIRHDSILYFGQALFEIFPAELGQDLFFEYGSQSEYTIFPKLVSLLLRVFSAGTISMVGVLIGFITFLLTSRVVASQLMAPKYLFFALLCLIVWPSNYGGFGVFKYQEPYLTGRTLSEPLALLGLAVLMQSRAWTALAILAISALLHPLQALPALLIWWVYQVRLFPWLLHLSIFLASVMLLLAWNNIAPFHQLIKQYDNQWWGIIAIPNQHIFISRWPTQHWLAVGIDVFALFVAYPFMNDKFRRFVKVLMIVVLSSFIASIVLVDLLRFILPAGLQLWRTHLILHWTAVLSMPLAAWNLWQQGRKSWPLLMLYISTWVFGVPHVALTAGYAAMATMMLYCAWPWLHRHIGVAYQKALLIALALGIFASYARYASYLLRTSSDWPDANVFTLTILLISYPLMLLALVVMGTLFYTHVKVRSHRILFAATLGFLAFTSLGWDQRSEAEKKIESYSGANSQSPFGYQIEAGARVYWEDQTLPIWLALKRAGYWNVNQEAGLLFNRGTALAAQQREIALQPLALQQRICSIFNELTKDRTRCQPAPDTIQELCKNASGGLDYLIFPGAIPTLRSLGSWSLSSADQSAPVPYHLYRCKNLFYDD